MQKFRRLGQWVSLALLVASAAGCASFSAGSPEAAVKARAEQYWKARVAMQSGVAYTFTTPAYRAVTTAQQYGASFGQSVMLKSGEVNNVTCAPQKCVVQIKLTVKPLLPVGSLDNIATYVDQTWLYEQGQWWLHQDL